MKSVNRRAFLRTSMLAVGAGLLARPSSSAWAQPSGANGDIRLAVIGLGSKGRSHIEQIITLEGVRIVALCDVDPELLDRSTARLRKENITVFSATDARQIFDRADVDAVLIASSTHWHALHTVWACATGKDVYVEKPISHSLWEGRQMVAAAKKHQRIVQAGTQFRSDTALPEIIAALRGGELGKIQYVHALWYKPRGDIGLKLPWYPDNLDYDLYCGPSPVVPLERNRLHYDWHWMWDTGNGDLANLGVHVLDISRRFVGNQTTPRRVLSLGGRYVNNDAAQTPNTQLTLFDFADIPVFFESRGLTAKPDVRYLDHQRGLRNGVIVQCENGYYAGYGGGALYTPRNKLIRRFAGDNGRGHIANFLDAVRARKSSALNAPIEEGHSSTALCHYGNASFRIGAPASTAHAREILSGTPAAQTALDSIAAHLAVHGIDLQTQPLTVGRWIEPGPDDTIAAIPGADEAIIARANFLLKGTHRHPYVLPKLA